MKFMAGFVAEDLQLGMRAGWLYHRPFRHVVQYEVVLPGDEEYDDIVTIWKMKGFSWAEVRQEDNQLYWYLPGLYEDVTQR